MWLLAAVGVAALVTWLWVLTRHINAAGPNSDGATVVLQAEAVLRGNVLLHGWWLSLDSWWTLDVLVFAVVAGIFGPHPALLLVVPALIAGLVIAAGVILARRGQRGAAAWAGGAVVVGILAFPGHVLASLFLVGPWHQTTTLCVLAAFIALRRGRFGPAWVLGVLLLAGGMLGDLMTAAYGAAPLALGGVVAVLRRRSLRAGAAPLAAAVTAAVAAYVVRAAAAALGAFRLGPTNPRAGATELPHNLHQLVTLALPGLFGIRSVAELGAGGVDRGLRAVHIVGLAVVAAGLLWALGSLLWGALAGRVPSEPSRPVARSEAEPWRLDDVLVLATFGSAASYVLLALNTSPAYFRYVTATVVFATVLAGRVVARWWASGLPARRWRWTAQLAAALTLGAFVAGTGQQLAQAAPVNTEPALITFLEAHHLTVGVGDYWSAAITTVDSGGRVRVRPVVVDAHGHLEGYNKGPVRSWFHGVAFQFVVFRGGAGFGGVDLPHAEQTWGPPAHIYLVDHHAYTVLTWSHPIHVTRQEPRLAGG
ncbi:MAG TPA: hypothetical protein VFN60_00880 [Acidimicrobiales bacterium]|nr:hypothetical protein [Acidimicrobiales bacterium]